MAPPHQIPLPFNISPALGNADFLISDVNREAFAWIDNWPDWPSSALIVYGPKGCGKTHLANIFKERTNGRLIDERHLRQSAPDTLLDGYRVAIIDDADDILSRGLHVEALHLYNVARESGRQLLLTSCQSPARWLISLPDLSSRLMSCPAVGINAPDDAMMTALLVKLFHDRQIMIDAEVVHFMVSRMERSFDAARCLVDKIDVVSQSAQRKVSVPLVRDVMTDAAAPAVIEG